MSIKIMISPMRERKVIIPMDSLQSHIGGVPKKGLERRLCRPTEQYRALLLVLRNFEIVGEPADPIRYGRDAGLDTQFPAA